LHQVVHDVVRWHWPGGTPPAIDTSRLTETGGGSYDDFYCQVRPSHSPSLLSCPDPLKRMDLSHPWNSSLLNARTWHTK